jgi:hypothetical protein
MKCFVVTRAVLAPSIIVRVHFTGKDIGLVVQDTSVDVMASIGPASRPIGPPSMETLPLPTTIVRLSLAKDPVQVPWTRFREVCGLGEVEDFAWGLVVADFSFGPCDRVLCFGLGLAG